MAIYRLKIVGVHYAVNAEYESVAVETEEMHRRTVERLSELGTKCPAVVLIADPTNPVDAQAVVAHVEGKRIGFVNKAQLDTVHALMKAAGRQTLIARLDEVNAVKHGWMYVTVDAADDLQIEPLQGPSDEWKGWTCTLPVIAPDEARFACIEAEAVLETLLSAGEGEGEATKQGAMDDADWDLVESYIRLWLDNSLHDLSNESRLMRNHYIDALKHLRSRNTTPPRIGTLVEALEKQRTAICGNKRMHLRTGVWWKQLKASKEMQLLWDTWKGRVEDDMERSMNELDTLLRTLPFDLYGLMSHKGLFFSRLHYNRVPRKAFHEIVSAMLLRERTLMEAGSPETGRQAEPVKKEAVPPVADEEETLFIVEIPQELQTPEAKRILDRLQKKGYLDADLQPVGLSGAKKGVLAWELHDRLGIKNIWKAIGVLWKCNGETIRKERTKRITTPAIIEFTKKIKAVIY